MYSKPTSFSISVLLLIISFSCKQKNETGTTTLPVSMDDSSRVIIDRAIEYAGGYDAWQQKRTLSFDKKSISYDSAGNITRELDQHLDYMLKPVFKSKITYMLHDTSIMLVYDGERARKSYNGKVSKEQKDIDAAWNSCFGSQYVMCIPYKLKDPGIKAEYSGEVILNDGTPAQVIKTSYIKGAGSNPDHIWFYYFEPGTGKLLANSLSGKNNFWDYTRYESFETSGGIIMPGIRKGFTADTLNRPGKLISKSRQSNIVFDKNFSSDYFKIKDAN